MLLKEAVRTLQEEIVDYIIPVASIVVIPRNVHAVPVAVLHLNIVPHMCGPVCGVVVSEDAYARDAEAIAYQLERLGVALADNSWYNESAEA